MLELAILGKREGRWGGDDLRQARWESSKRGCVTKPAIASGQNRSRHLATWNGSREAVFQKLFLGPIHQRNKRQAVYLQDLCIFLSLTGQNPMHFQTYCLYFASGEARASEGTVWTVPEHGGLIFQAVGCLGLWCS